MMPDWDFMAPFPDKFQRMAQRELRDPYLKLALLVPLILGVAPNTLRSPIKQNGIDKLPQSIFPLS